MMISLDGVMQAPWCPEEDTSEILNMVADRPNGDDLLVYSR